MWARICDKYDATVRSITASRPVTALRRRVEPRRPFTPGRERELLQYGRYAILILIILMVGARFVRLTYDFPPGLTPDGDALTDEGLYGHNAINHYLSGTWYVEKDFNQVINAPLLQVVQAYCYQIFGFGLFTARAVVLMFGLLQAAGVYLIVRRWMGHWTSLLAAGLLLVNHLHFAFSRASIAEVPMAALVTWSLVFAVYARGKLAYLNAFLASVVFTGALLTKTNAIFVVPLLGLIMILVEPDWRRVLVKFVICSATFFLLMGIYYVLIVRPNMEDFLYYYTLNIGVTSSYHPADVWEQFWYIVGLTRGAEPIAFHAIVLLGVPFLLLSRRLRANPLVYIAVLWYVLYLLLFATYGRFYNRFFPAILPAIAILMAVFFREAWLYRGRFWPVAYGFAGLTILAVALNTAFIGKYMAYGENSFNEAAAEIRRIMDADPESNNVLMGQTAASFALRNGALPRHDRYGLDPLAERLRFHQPSYLVSEAAIRNFPLEPYYRHREPIEAYARLEAVAEFDVLENYRHHPIVLYKVHPHEPPEAPATDTEMDAEAETPSAAEAPEND